MTPPVLSHGSGSVVQAADGRTLVDLTMGFGAAFLGHSHPEVTRRLQEQAGRMLACGRLETPAQARVEALLRAWLPSGLRPAGLYSTGMEVAEFALRVAAVQTGRGEFAAFSHGMHGKSAMTAALCWPNAPVRPGNAHVLPFVAQAAEGEILEALEGLLRTRRLAALLVEPIQGSNAGHEAPAGFYDRAIELCRAHGTLCVFDEILTGLHRTGPRFYVDGLREPPDILLYAKCLGNGFPVSGIALGERVEVAPGALPGSTFSGNPMALAAVEGTLTAMGGLELPARVAAIEATVRAALEPVQGKGVTLRGRGALWFLEFGDRAGMQRALAAIGDAGVLVTGGERFIRLLPAATIEPSLLQEACATIAGACEGLRV
jgi:acetylornithine/succinyldiaminopimelate/putrescine aminotransferase